MRTTAYGTSGLAILADQQAVVGQEPVGRHFQVAGGRLVAEHPTGVIEGRAVAGAEEAALPAGRPARGGRTGGGGGRGGGTRARGVASRSQVRRSASCSAASGASEGKVWVLMARSCGLKACGTGQRPAPRQRWSRRAVDGSGRNRLSAPRAASRGCAWWCATPPTAPAESRPRRPSRG